MAKITEGMVEHNKKLFEEAQYKFYILLKELGYTSITEYISNKKLITIRCSEGHERVIYPFTLKRSGKCKICFHIDRMNKSYVNFIKLLDKDGYELVGEYKGMLCKTQIKCNEGHIYESKPNQFQQFQRCPQCKGSTGQRLLEKMFRDKFDYNIICNDRKVVGGNFELDIYFPDIKVAIEYNGDYWHSREDQIIRDKKKHKICESKGIKIFTVSDGEFLKSPEIVFNKVSEDIVSIYNQRGGGLLGGI